MKRPKLQPERRRRLQRAIATEIRRIRAKPGVGPGVEGCLADLAERLERIYDDAFPKVCRCCNRIYRTHEDFMDHTQVPKAGRSAQFDTEDETVQAYRDCACGSTLLVLIEDRRDVSAAGVARRALFDEALDRLRNATKEHPAVLRRVLRAAFRRVMDESTVTTVSDRR